MEIRKHSTDSQRPPIQWLPEELVSHVLDFCDFFSLHSAEQVCRKWKRLIDGGPFWKNAYLKLSEGWTPEANVENWKVLTRRHFFTEFCMTERHKALLTHVEALPFDSQKQKIRARRRLFSYLRFDSSTLEVFYALCGGPHIYHKIPTEKTMEPSQPGIRHIFRVENGAVLQFRQKRKIGAMDTFGFGILRYDDRIGGIRYIFAPYTMEGVWHICWVTINGCMTKHYRAVKRWVRHAIDLERSATASSPLTSYLPAPKPD